MRGWDPRDSTYYDEPEEAPPANGDGDVATDGRVWQLLLVRGLKGAVDENMLAKGLEKLYRDDSQQPPQGPPPSAMPLPPGMPARQPAPLGARPQSLKRVFVIRDRVTGQSCGYGFAEYYSQSDATAALAKAKHLGKGCTISSKPIEVCHPHFGVFHPVALNQTPEEQKYAFDFNEKTVKYPDIRYYASPQMVNAQPPAPPESQSPAKEATTTKTKKRTTTEARGILDKPAEPTKKKPKKEFGMVALLNRNQAQARGKDGEAEAIETNPKTNTRTFSGANHDSATGTGGEQSFAFDGENGGKALICCFLCGSAFPQRDALERHVQMSEKHAENYKDDDKFGKGLERMKKRGVSEEDTLKVKMKKSKAEQNESEKQEEEESTPEYKDRAAIRREEEAKAKAGGAFHPVSLKDAAARKAKGGNQQTNTTTAPPAPPSMGIGRRMLQSAGWQEGQGLGSGNGITAPIEQNVYAAGVGLGHAGSKQGDAVEEAQRQTRSDGGGFVEKTRDAARKRFEDMN